MMRFLMLPCLALLAACGAPQPPLVATDVEITSPMPGRQMSAGYLVLTNNTDEPIVIDAVTSPHFGAVELHETTIENGISRMRQMEELVIPANGSVRLERGGKHLMLMRSKGPDGIITLQFLSRGAPVLTIEQQYDRKMD
jgi:copper(I)-binding protein